MSCTILKTIKKTRSSTLSNSHVILFTVSLIGASGTTEIYKHCQCCTVLFVFKFNDSP